MKTNTMTEKIKILLLAVLLALGLMLASFLAGWKVRGKQIAPNTTDTIRIHTTDTLRIVEKIHDTTILTYTKTVQVPFYIVDTDTIVDSVWVSLPYEQHFARLDTVADVWYSGYDAKIDSAVVYKHTTTQIIKQPYEVARMPRLTLDVGAAAFYHERQVFPCLVGEMRYNANRMTLSAFGGVTHKGEWGVGVGVTYRMNLIK